MVACECRAIARNRSCQRSSAGTPLMNGEKIYEYDLDITGVTDFGVSLEAILSGQEAVLSGER